VEEDKAGTMYALRKRAVRIGARRDVAKLFRRSLVSFAFLFVGLAPSTANSQVIECRSEKGDGYPWAWREIDGRRCWYKGKAGKDKTLLRWSEGANTSASNGSPSIKHRPSLIDQYGEREQLLHSYWPPLPGDAIEAVRGKRL
jgi:hypothetical protein